MAADSRLTLSFLDQNFKDPENPNAKLLIAVPQSDATQKLFLAHSGIGISTCGDASIQNVPISGFIESFILTLPKEISVADAAFDDFQRHQYRPTSRDSSDYIYLERKTKDVK